MHHRTASMLLAAALCLSPYAPLFSTQILATEVNPETTVIDVTDFGADPTGMSDSTEAVEEAIKKAKSIDGHVTINFPNGEYHFDEDHATTRLYHLSNTGSKSYPEKKISILLEDAENIALQGNGSSIIVHGDIMAIAAVRSKNITIKGFSIDYKDADTIDVSIVGTGQDENGKPYADIYVPTAYNYKISDDKRHVQWQGDLSRNGKPYWTWEDADFCQSLVIYKGYDRTVIRQPDKWNSNPFNDVNKIEENGDSVLRFTYNNRLPQNIEEGNIYLLSDSYTRRTAGAFFWESENLLVEDTDIHYLSGFGWLTQICKNVEFKGVNMLPRFGSGKYTSSNADQIHVAGCGGYFKVTDCSFAIAHDDPINIHGTYMRVDEVIDSRTVKLTYVHYMQGGFAQFHPGDEVNFYTRTWLEPAYGQDENNPFIVESSIGPGETYNGSTLNNETEIVTFKEDLPQETLDDLRKTIGWHGTSEALFVAENSTYTPEVTISGNHFKSIPTRGILCTTRKPTVIENNTFDNMAMANIYLSNDSDFWYESGPITDMTIRNNTFYVRPTGSTEWGDVPGIFVNPVTVDANSIAWGENTQRHPESSVHRNINIDSNTFHLSSDHAVRVERVDGVNITNNTVLNDLLPDLSLNCPTSLSLGQSAQLDASATRSPLWKDVFSFMSCRNVKVSGNKFGDDLNLNIRLDGDMSENDITSSDSALTLNQSGGNPVASASEIHYLSSDPAIATVDENGMLRAIKAGTCTISAWAKQGDKLISSNTVTLTIEGEEGEAFTLDAEKRTASKRNETIQLSASAQNVTWEVLDPVTRRHYYKGVVDENGTYTALQHGAVLVRASKGSANAEMLISNAFGEKFESSTLADGWMYHNYSGTNNTSNGNLDRISGLDAYTVHFDTEDSGDGPWVDKNNLKNVLHFEVPEDLKNDFRIQVDASNLTLRSDKWGSDGVMLYTDMDNYIFAGKRQHQSGIAALREADGNCEEFQGSATDNELTDTTFEFEGKGNTLTIRYTDRNGQWKTAKELDIAFLKNKPLQFAAATWENHGEGQNPIYSGFRIAKASESTTETFASQAQPKVLFEPSAHTSPVLQAASLKAQGRHLSATFTAQTSDIQIAQTLYFWTLTGSDGKTYTAATTTPEWTAPAAGEAKVDVVVVDDKGEPSRVVSSSAVSVADEQTSPGKFSTIYFNDVPVAIEEGRNEYSLSMPMADTVRLAWPANESAQETVINADGNALTVSNKSYVLAKAAQTYEFKRANQTITVKVDRLLSSNTALKSMSYDGKAIDMTDEIRTGTDSYFVHPENTSFPLHFETADANAKISVRQSFYDIPVENTSGKDNVFDGELDMTSGINAVYIDVTAPDGKTVREYKLYFFKDVFANADPVSITLNGTELENFSADKDEYTVHVDSTDALKLVVNTANGQSAAIRLNENYVRSNEMDLALNPGSNEADIQITAPDFWTRRTIRLNVVANDDKNADLLSFKLAGEKLDIPAIDDGSVIETEAHQAEVPVELIGLSDNTDINIKNSATGQIISGRGKAEGSLKIGEGKNTFTITVSEEGKKDRVLTLNVNGEGLVWASDVMASYLNGSTLSIDGAKATYAKVGYGNPSIDINIDGTNDIRLIDENGDPVAFKKGIGAHAFSQLEYHFDEGHDFTRFEAYCGIDYSQASLGTSSVNFEAWVDDKLVYSSNETLGEAVTGKTPMQKVDIDITGASKLVLFANEIDNNYNDHAMWADAKFRKPLPELKADKSELETKLAQAKAIEESSVSAEKWQKLQAAIEDAQAVVDNNEASAEDIANAIKVLEEALNWNDGEIDLDKSLLEFLLDQTRNYSENDFSTGTFSIFATIRQTVADVLNTATTQEEIDQAIDEFHPSILELRRLPSEDALAALKEQLGR